MYIGNEKKYVNFYVDGVLLCRFVDVNLVSPVVKNFLDSGIGKELRIVPASSLCIENGFWTVHLPAVSERDLASFADGLRDVFSEWSFCDESVGIFPMSPGEFALADALMNKLDSLLFEM